MKSKFISNIFDFVKRNDADFLVGSGIGLFFTGIGLTVLATIKTTKEVEKKKQKENIEKLPAKEVLKMGVKHYIAPAITVAAATACIISGDCIHHKRNTALVAACAMGETVAKEYADYREKVKDMISEKKEQEVHAAINQDKIDANPPKKSEVIFTGRGPVLCYDSITGRYFNSSIEDLRHNANILNKKMRNEMAVTLNDWYYEIGLNPIAIGDDMGWSIDDNYLELDFSSNITDENEPCVVVGFVYPPKFISY